MDKIVDIREFLKNQEIVIYGAGHVANKFYNSLQRLDLDKNVKCFVVSSKREDQDEFNGHKIISVDELQKGEACVCIAVHEVLKGEIEVLLERKGIHNHIWIHPYLPELRFGVPLKAGALVPVSQIVHACKDYRLAIRQLTIENYFHLNESGDDIYIKAQQIWCDRDTAEKRLIKFKELIGSFNDGGYNPNADPKEPIMIDTDYRIMEGAHRISCARYFGIESVACNIYDRVEDYDGWMGNCTINESVIHGGFFLPEEIKIIEDAYLRIQ